MQPIRIMKALTATQSYPLPATPFQRNPVPSRLFKSFWMAGFEASCHINRAGERLDLIAATQHDVLAVQDYARLREMGIRTVRDGVRWHLIDRAGRYDFSSLAPMALAAQQQGMQVIWDLCHYGWPDDVDFFSPAFVDRFARFCSAVTRFLAGCTDGIPFYLPVNEISFLAWAIGTRRLIYPFARDRSLEAKRQLVRAAIAGIEAIWPVDRRARIVHADPIFNVVAPRDLPELAQAAANKTASQYEAWDMLAGQAHPDLGGHPRYLDIIGVNYYHSNQWEYPDIRLHWEDTPRDERWIPLWWLLDRVYRRYRRPLFIAETGHFGAGRATWIREVADEVRTARQQGIPVQGICLYPIVDRPDWENPGHWHNCGLWDLRPDADGRYERVVCEELAAELSRLIVACAATSA